MTMGSAHNRMLIIVLLAVLACACTEHEHARPVAARARPSNDTVATVPLKLFFIPGQVTGTIGGEPVPTERKSQRSYPKGMRLPYVFAAMDSTAKLSVWIDSVAVPATGVLVADRAHELIAVAMPAPHVPIVGPQNRELYRLEIEMLTSKAPAPLFQAMSDEVGCLMQWYGEDRGQQLGADAYEKAIADLGDPGAAARLEKALAGAKIEARGCTKKKPD